MPDRKRNRTDNGTDRLQEIRARLDGLSWVGDEFIAHAPADIAWLLAGYALAVDTIWAGYEAINGCRMPPAERAEMLAAWGVTDDDIAWAKRQEAPND